jgi:hypothetical protein
LSGDRYGFNLGGRVQPQQLGQVRLFETHIIHKGGLLEQEVHRLRSQLEHLRRAYQAEIETHLEERSLLVEEITRLKQVVPA